MNLLDTLEGSLLEGWFPAGWDLARIDACCSHAPEAADERQPFWDEGFAPVCCESVADLNVRMGHDIALEIRRAAERDQELALILPVGPMGMYRWVVYFLRTWGVSAGHVHTFNMDEWSDAAGNTLAPDDPGAFQHAMEQALFEPLAVHTVPPGQRHYATREALPRYADDIASLRRRGARLVLVYGIGRVFHIAFWEPHFAGEYADADAWRAQTHRLGARLHPLTVEQNAITSFRSRTTLVPCYANTIGPGIFLQADRAIGGCDGALGRGMQWQGMSLWVTLRYGPDVWVPSSFIPTLPGSLYHLRELAGPLEPDVH